MRAVAEVLSQEDMARGVIEEIVYKDDLMALLPFSRTDGKAYVYTREKTNSEGVFLDVNEVVPEGASEVEEVITRLRIIAGDVDVDKFMNETMSDTNQQLAIQIALKAKGMSTAFRRALIQGDSAVNTKSFDGLNKLVSGTGNHFAAGANGSSLSLSALDELIDAINGRPDALMMRPGTFRALKALWRASGGNTGGMMQIDNFGLSVPAHDGIPIIINEFIPAGVTQGTNVNTTSVYAMRLNEVDGVHGLFGGESAGIRVESIGTVQNKDAERTRLKWYVGVALKATKSLSALRGVNNV
jgi:hypothetical protein